MPPTEEQTYREGIKQDLKDIKEQTLKTNGRVTRLEKIALVLLTAIAVLTVSNPTLFNAVKLLAL